MKKEKRGRPKAPGKPYHLYVRYIPGLHPPELEQLLEKIMTAPVGKRNELIAQALIGGAEQVNAQYNGAEDVETTDLLNDLFG